MKFVAPNAFGVSVNLSVPSVEIDGNCENICLSTGGLREGSAASKFVQLPPCRLSCLLVG